MPFHFFIEPNYDRAFSIMVTREELRAMKKAMNILRRAEQAELERGIRDRAKRAKRVAPSKRASATRVTRNK